ncbi:hypothetical protein [Microbacterium sp. 22242]|uniref:hypothetical protein n=1 Tax=Microbacterium sp. 22242 TaxID=3453896 RepID=UPI003F86544A
MLHAAVLLLMTGSAITAAACCLVAGGLAPPAVPWQSRQSAVVMALGMVALCAGGGDARVPLLVAAAGIASAMLGVVGTRGRAHADACFHRALGCVVMALCALAVAGARLGPSAPVPADSGHAGHGALVPMSWAAGAGVLALLGLMLVARARQRGGLGRRATVVGRVDASRAAGLRGAEVGAPVLRRGVLSGPILLEAEGGAMAISLIVMAAMVLTP